MYRTLRELDRKVHANFYPQLFFPEIYLLEGGYKEFYLEYPTFCQGKYRAMVEKEFKEDCKDKYSKTKRLFKQYSTKEACSRLLSD